MEEKVQAILKLMEVMGVSIDDLKVFNRSIEATKKFPLEVYYDDKTKSDDLEYYKKGLERCPIGIVIGDTVFALPSRINSPKCGEALKYCKEAFGRGIIGSLPIQNQFEMLKEHLTDYDKISFYLEKKRLGDDDLLYLAIEHPNNREHLQYYYDFKREIIASNNSWVPTLPIINLKN